MGARGGGGSRGGGAGGGGMSKERADMLAKFPGLAAIKDKKLLNDQLDALSAFEKEYGIKTPKIELTNLKEGNYGTTWSHTRNIELSDKQFGMDIVGVTKQMTVPNFVTTNSPTKHTLTHELAHTVWSKHHRTPQSKAAGKEVLRVYRRFLKDTGAKGWGSYSKTGYGEFFAEGITKHMYGQKDQYTTALHNIVKKYGL